LLQNGLPPKDSGLRVTRSLGDYHWKVRTAQPLQFPLGILTAKPETSSQRLSNTHIGIVLGSGGIFDHDTEAVHLTRVFSLNHSTQTCAQLAQSIVTAAGSKPENKNDLTAVVAKFNWLKAETSPVKKPHTAAAAAVPSTTMQTASSATVAPKDVVALEASAPKLTISGIAVAERGRRANQVLSLCTCAKSQNAIFLQDRHLIVENMSFPAQDPTAVWSLMCIFDGHGHGADVDASKATSKAADYAKTNIERHLENEMKKPNVSVTNALIAAVEALDKAFISTITADDET
jgi:serine/threonine protein phosphatase PrpC